jgi:surfactin synthase thioesterase subunit
VERFGKAFQAAIVSLALGAVACSSPADHRRTQSPSASVDTTHPGPLTLAGSPPSGHWSRYRIDRNGGRIDLYVAHDDTPKPVVILIQGSGCTPLMTVDPDATWHDTTLFQDEVRPWLDRLHFAVVEKRGVEPLRFSQGMSQREKEEAFRRAETECSTEFLQNVTKENRVEDTAATVSTLARQPWAREIILLGHSEGTHVATGVLRKLKDTKIAAAGLFASAGPIPFFGGYVARGAGDRERFQSVFEQVRMLQRADDNFMFEGHPARRWKTFWLESTPLDDVRESTVPLFVAQGTRDGTTLPADLFALEAIRQQPHRPIRYVVVPDGGHAFDTPDGKSHLGKLFEDFVHWALDVNRQTSLGIVK